MFDRQKLFCVFVHIGFYNKGQESEKKDNTISDWLSLKGVEQRKSNSAL